MVGQLRAQEVLHFTGKVDAAVHHRNGDALAGHLLAVGCVDALVQQIRAHVHGHRVHEFVDPFVPCGLHVGRSVPCVWHGPEDSRLDVTGRQEDPALGPQFGRLGNRSEPLGLAQQAAIGR